MPVGLSAAWLLAWAQSGFSPDPMPLPTVEVGPSLATLPVLRWSAALPGIPPATSSRSEPAPPILRGDRIYVGYSGVSALLILNRGDGTLIGSLPTSGVVASAPVFVDGHILVADLAGYLWCFDEKTGEKLWSRYTSAPVVSSPTPDGDLIFATNVDDQVYAYDAATGELRWRFAHRSDAAKSEKLSLYGAPPAVVMGESVVAGFSDGYLVSIHRANGEEEWSLSVGEGAWPDLIAPPTVADSVLVVGGFSGPLLGLDPVTRTMKWRVEAGSASAFLRDGNTVYAGGADGVLRKVDVRTGDVAWTWQADIPGLSISLTEETTGKVEEKITSGTLGTPIMSPQGLLVTNSDGGLYLLDPNNGQQKWSLDPGYLLNGVLAAPAIDGDEVYLVSNGGRLFALRGQAPKGEPALLPWQSPMH